MSCDRKKRKSIHPSIQPYIYQSISVPIATRRIIICGNQMWRDRDPTSSLGGNNHFHKLLSTLTKRLSATRNCPPHPSVVPPAHLPVCLPTWRSTSSANRLQFLLQNQVQLLLLPSLLLLFFLLLSQWTAAIRPRRLVDSKSKQEKVNAILQLTHLARCILDETPRRACRICTLREIVKWKRKTKAKTQRTFFK